MPYYDDDDNKYYEEYYENVEPIEIVSEAFSAETITPVLESVGLVMEETPRYSGNMERLIFAHGNDKEVYSSAEIRFTEKIDNVLMYSDYTKTMRQGLMVCRVIAAKIDDIEQDAIVSCVAFEKIVNKALDGFNIFFFVTNESVFFGCRVFDQLGKYDLALSNPIREQYQFEEIKDEFAFAADTEEFVDYYRQIRSIISYNQDIGPNYEELFVRQKGIKINYLDDLDAIGDALGVSFKREKERYCDLFFIEPEESFAALLDSVCEDLDFIKSNRVNTYEILFEADEMMRRAEQDEIKDEQLTISPKQEDEEKNRVSDEEVRSLLNDPEEMIKVLKRRRGL